jgi:hypothetical protein
MLCSFFANAQIQAPFVGTEVTLNITQNAARLQFNVNRNGSNTNYSVIYSKSPNLNPAVGQTPNGPVITVFGWQTRFFDINGLQPNTTYYWQVTASNGLGVTRSVIVNFVTLGVPALPAISSISTSNITQNSAKINYELTPNNAATTSIIKYGISDTTLTNQATGLTASGSVNNIGQITLTSLLPFTTYYYQVEATNSVGTVTGALQTFSTSTVPAPQLIAEYTFDNTYSNFNGNAPFVSNAGTSFTTDRNGTTNSAIKIDNSGTSAAIAGLPDGSSARSISVWAKINVLNNQINYVFHYGNSANGNGLALRPTTTLYFANAAANLETADTNTINTWVHYVCTYDGTSAKVYKNGVLFSSGPKTFNTVNNSNFFNLGLTEGGAPNYFIGAIDDLKIYNYALSATEIASLHLHNNLSSKDFSTKNLKVSLYPNPVKDILNIETETEIKSIAIYNLLGQKVKTAKSRNINVADLSNGTYMVRVEDVNNAVETMKIVKQ